jgi:hypothetical protein
MNEKVESLELNNVHLIDDKFDLWSMALSFLRTNKALKRIDVVAMLQDNTSLECLSISQLPTVLL